MATADIVTKPHDKHNRSKLFSWMKRLTKNKSSSKKHTIPSSLNAPHDSLTYGREDLPTHGDNVPDHGFSTLLPAEDGSATPNDANQSLSPTFATNAGAIDSENGPSEVDRNSKSGTSHTLTGGMSATSGGGGNSTFSSSNHSSHSLATTLTTIQSAAPSHGQAPLANGHHGPHNSAYSPAYPPAPPSAIPPHLNPHVPTTYRSATANNLLSDNASVLTLASSSHRPQRRNSLDTNASIRAIAPSSVWGGSRESLPLSVLSQNADGPATSTNTPPPTAGIISPGSRNVSALTNSERGTGVGAPLLSSERNSVYTNKASAKDGDSIRSGVLTHGRNDSTAGSIGGYSSPLIMSQGSEAHDGDKSG